MWKRVCGILCSIDVGIDHNDDVLGRGKQTSVVSLKRQLDGQRFKLEDLRQRQAGTKKALGRLVEDDREQEDAVAKRVHAVLAEQPEVTKALSRFGLASRHKKTDTTADYRSQLDALEGVG